MRALFYLAVLCISIARSQATVITLDGDLSWNITEPRCSFRLKGKLQNLTSEGSNALKIALFLTPNIYPSAGAVVGECALGSIGSRFQLSDFTLKTVAKIPSVSGEYYFTIAVAEYTATGWRNVLVVRSEPQTLLSGNFVGQPKWVLPTKPVLPPAGLLVPGKFFQLTLKATDEKNLFPSAFQEKIILSIKPKRKLTSTLRSKTTSAKYTYAAKLGKFGGKKVDYGELVIQPTSSESGVSKAVYSFYFSSFGGGTYRCVETGSSGKETTWGTFKLY